MNRLVLIALAFALVFNFAASQVTDHNTSNSTNNANNTINITSTTNTSTSNNTNSTNNTNNWFPSLWVKTCSAMLCNSSCSNCLNSTWINNTNATNPLVLCPQNSTFCFIDTYLTNGSWTVQNCSSCSNSSNTSCTGCSLINNTFVKDFCTVSGTCWSINYNSSLAVNVTNSSNTSAVLLTETCSSSACGISCLNCSNSTRIDNISNTQVVCPQNGTFCYVNYYWNNGTASLQNCTTCANSSNTSCTGCNWVIGSLVKDFCAANGSCWSISFNTSNNNNNSSMSNTTTVVVVTNLSCNCNNTNNGTTGMTGVDANGNSCDCTIATANTTQYSNNSRTGNVTSKLVNASFVVASAVSLQVSLAAIMVIFSVFPGWILL